MERSDRPTEDRRSRRAVLALIGAAFVAGSRPGLAARQSEGTRNVYQLRIYEIFDTNKAAFHARFRDQCIPIMKRYGFEIAAMWEAKGEKGPEFVYLLRWPDEATLERQWAAFMADAEWSRIKSETQARHGPMVGAIQSRAMTLVDYSGSV